MENHSNSKIIRKRGRPAGKSRKPLNKEEKKARNAQYERERRVEIAEATSQLAEAIGVDQSITLSVLLNSALRQIRRASQNPPQSVRILKKRNEELSKEIHELERVLVKKKDKEASESERESKTDEEEMKGTTSEHGILKEQQPSTSNIGQEHEDCDILFNSEFIIPTEIDLDIEPSDILTWFD